MSLQRYRSRPAYGAQLQLAGMAGRYVRQAYNSYMAPTPVQRAVMKTVARSAARTARTRSTRSRKPARKNTSKIKKIQKQVKKLQKYDATGMGVHTHRELDANTVGCDANAMSHNQIPSPLGIAQIELVLANLKFFDPSNPGTLITSNVSTGTYARNIDIASLTQTLWLKNSNRSTVKYCVYLCTVKDDTAILPDQLWLNGIPSQSNLTTREQLGQYPTDYNVLNDLWHLKVACKGMLQAGEGVSCTHSVKDIEYDPATTDSHALTYQKEYKAFSFLVVIEGDLARDNALEEYTTINAALDLKYKSTYVIKYNAGANLHRTHVVNNMHSGFTNFGVQANKPEVQVQAK